MPGTVADDGKARSADVVAIQTVQVDIDHGDVKAMRAHLGLYLRSPSLEVGSGGLTEDGQERRHLYWTLPEPAIGGDLSIVCKPHAEIAAKIGADPSSTLAHQPMRVADSIYRKGGVERVVEIRAHQELEYDPRELAERVETMPSLSTKADLPERGSSTSKAKQPVRILLVERVREYGADWITRFDALTRGIGYWICRRRDGRVTRERMFEEIAAYNEACIVPPWSTDKLKQKIERLWRLDRERAAADNIGANDVSSPGDVTEDSLAREFTRRHGNDWRYLAAWSQ